MPGVFLSYRRSDAGGWAGRVKDHLVLRFGPDRVWQDVDDLGVGTDYLPQILANISTADAVLIVIGPHWLDEGEAGGKARLRDPKDVLRLEIQHALKKPSGVIPTLVGGAQMPKASDLPRSMAPLVKRNGIALSDADWSRAMQLLFERLQDLSRAARSIEAVAVPALPDTLNQLDQLQNRYFEQLVGNNAPAAAATAREGLRLLDDQMPNYPHDRTLQLFRGFFLKNLAMALRDSGDTRGFEANLALAAQAFDTIRSEAELHLANAYTGAAAIPMLRGQGAPALELINRALALAPDHPFALHDREEIRRFFNL
jgi:TIR domain